MSDDAVAAVWISETEPREDAARSLAEWAQARGVVLVPGDDLATSGAPKPEPDLDARIEKEIARARDAVGALDADTAERALARAERILRDHPELPQAAWLRAEVDRTWASRFLRVAPKDEGRALASWQHAAALDGGRVAGVGETDQGRKASTEVTIALTGAGKRARFFFDGVETEARAEGGRTTTRVKAAPAEHHIVVYDGDRIALASWIAISDGTASIEIPVSRPSTCARSTFGGVVREGDRILAEDITCPRWVAAIAGERPGSVLVARCSRDFCGPLLEWRTERGAYGSPQGIMQEKKWPAWATWTLLGTVAATATFVTLAATGVFETRPVEQRFIAGGARNE